MLVPPLSRQDNYPVEFNLVITMESILPVLVSLQPQLQLQRTTSHLFNHGLLSSSTIPTTTSILSSRLIKRNERNKIDLNHTHVIDSHQYRTGILSYGDYDDDKVPTTYHHHYHNHQASIADSPHSEVFYLYLYPINRSHILLRFSPSHMILLHSLVCLSVYV